MNAARRTQASALTLLLFLLASLIPAYAVDYYISPGGNDAADGSLANPWASLAKANAMVVPGDTVWLRAGTYSGVIRPASSGASHTNRIVYRVFGDGDVILNAVTQSGTPEGTGTIGLTDRNYVTVSGLAPAPTQAPTRLRVEPAGYTDAVASFCGGEGNVVEYIEARCPSDGPTCGRGVVFCLNFWPGDRVTKFNVLRNSTIIGGSSTSLDPTLFTEDLVTLAQRAHHNVIEGNRLSVCRHAVLYADSPTSYSNVIRSNVIENAEHTGLSVWSAGVGLPAGARFLIEGNTLSASAGNNAPDGGLGNAFQWGSDELIIRHNVIRDGGSLVESVSSIGGLTGATSTSFGSPYFATDSRVYHNTITANGGVALGMFDFGVEPVDLGRNTYVNNIFYDSQSTVTGPLLALYWDTNRPTGDRFVRNLWGRPGGVAENHVVIRNSVAAATLAVAIDTWVGPAQPDLSAWQGWDNYYDAEPGFVDYATRDLRLTTGHANLDRGAPLTLVANSDTGGEVLVVTDARFFFGEADEFPDWMAVRGERIRVGYTYREARSARVLGVDDTTSSLLLDQPIERKPGESVWITHSSAGQLLISGDGPAVGAHDSVELILLSPFEPG